MRTNIGDNTVRHGRLRKAEQFAASAEVILATADRERLSHGPASPPAVASPVRD